MWYLDNVTQGMVYFSDALSPDERDFADFDAQFPMKEKEITPSQAEFATASTDIDTHEYHTA